MCNYCSDPKMWAICTACHENTAPCVFALHSEDGRFCRKERCRDIGYSLIRLRHEQEKQDLRIKGMCIYWTEHIGWCGVRGYNNYPAAFSGADPMETRVPQKALPGTDYCGRHTASGSVAEGEPVMAPNDERPDTPADAALCPRCGEPWLSSRHDCEAGP